MTDPIQAQQPQLYLVYAAAELPRPDQETLFMRLEACDQTLCEESTHIAWSISNPQQTLGEIHFNPHRIRFAGLSNPLPPDLTNQTIHTTSWQPQIKANMRQHSAHLSLAYEGSHPDPVEKMIALYETAHAFENENLLGVINPQAWTAHPPADYLQPDHIRHYRQQFPFNLWIGYVKFFTDKQHYWLVTKGHHIFDVPDLAYFIQQNESPEEIIHHFINIFYYIYHQDVTVTAGDTLTIGKRGIPMAFKEVSEYPEILMGPSGTLVIEKINAETP